MRYYTPATLLLLTSCSAVGGSPGLTAQCRNAEYGAEVAAARIEAFLSAAGEFSDAAIEAEVDLIAGCRQVGVALEMPVAQLNQLEAQGVRALCDAVRAQLSADFAALRGPNVEVTVVAVPPRCEVSVNAYASCVASCDAVVDPGLVDVTCEGGEFRGRCTANCQGSCAVQTSAVCSGRCEGLCDGTCSQTGPNGSCAGTCNGTCRGECVVETQASCTGECRGMCSVAFEEPYCTGEIRRPSVSAECDANCDAEVSAQATCEPGRTELMVTGTVDPAQVARRERVALAVSQGIQSILTVRARLEKLAVSGAAVVRLAPDVPVSARTLGVGAVTCATAGAAAIAEAAASVSVSVEVSVQVSASASVSSN